jgi:hypothetical protein
MTVQLSITLEFKSWCCWSCRGHGIRNDGREFHVHLHLASMAFLVMRSSAILAHGNVGNPFHTSRPRAFKRDSNSVRMMEESGESTTICTYCQIDTREPLPSRDLSDYWQEPDSFFLVSGQNPTAQKVRLTSPALPLPPYYVLPALPLPPLCVFSSASKIIYSYDNI